jgi:hypothetical protein
MSIYVTFFIIKGKKLNPRYRECIKYQAIGIGGHALDDNNEFMFVGNEENLELLKCFVTTIITSTAKRRKILSATVVTLFC